MRKGNPDRTTEKRKAGRPAGLLENALRFWKACPDPEHRLNMLKSFRLALAEDQYLYALCLQPDSQDQTASLWNTELHPEHPAFHNRILYPAAFHEGGAAYIAFLNRNQAERYASPRPSAQAVLVSLEALLQQLCEQTDLEGLYINEVQPENLLLADELLFILEGSPHSFARGGLQGELLVKQTDPAMLKADGIVRPLYSPGVPEEYCETTGEPVVLPDIRPGQAEVTECTDGSCRWLLQTLVPAFDPLDGQLSLSACYWNALESAWQLRLSSLAVPLLGYPYGGYPLQESTETAIASCSQWLRRHPDAALRIVLTAADDDEFEAFGQASRALYTARPQSGGLKA